jgi:hypothetical protein
LFSWTEPEKPRAVPSGSGNFAGNFRKAIVEAVFEGKAVIEHCDAIRFVFPHANQYRAGFNSSRQRNVTATFIRQGVDGLVELTLNSRRETTVMSLLNALGDTSAKQIWTKCWWLLDSKYRLPSFAQLIDRSPRYLGELRFNIRTFSGGLRHGLAPP